MKLDQRLIRGEEDKELFLSQFKNCKDVRNKIAKVLTAELESVILSGESENNYDCPNALAKIADNNGYKRALRSVIKLLAPEEV